MDLCFIRTFINLSLSLLTVYNSGKHVIRDVPEEKRGWLFMRCVAGLTGFTCMVFSVKYLPIFISAIVFNTAPFWTAILGFFMLGNRISCFDLFMMIGCFTGITILSLYQNRSSQVLSEDEEHLSTSIIDNIHSTQITSFEFIIGMSCILTCSITYSLVSVLTQKLKTIHFSLMMFHYGWVASSMVFLYLILEHISTS